MAHRWIPTLLLVGALVAPASAKPEFLELLRSHYRPAAGSALANAGCVACHTAPPTHNSFGVQLKAAVSRANPRTLSIAILLAAESGDADQDGWLNGDEIRQGTLPGDPESHPESAPDALPDTTLPVGPSSPSSASAATGAAAEASADKPLIPLHSFHPAIVHFPIALFLFGALLDALGAWRGSRALRQAGCWNMLGGAAAATLAIPTGIAAYLRLGFAFSHVALHFWLAVGAALAMGCTVAYRRRHEAPKGAYWAALALAAALVGTAGHFGSAMVFG